MRHAGVLLVSLLPLGCWSGPSREDFYVCTDDRDCPAGWICRAGTGGDRCFLGPIETDAGSVTHDAGDGSVTHDAGVRQDAGDGSTPDDAGVDAGARDAGPPLGSAGCGLVDPLSGARTLAVGGDVGDYLVSLPPDYDPERPYPLGFGFHGSYRTHENCRDGDCTGFQTAMGDEAVLVYVKSIGVGWEATDVRDRNATLFEAVLDVMLAEYCIESDRVFVAGTSSGAHFANIVACRYGDRLLAAVPVAGYLPERDCVGGVAALVIHGVDDSSFAAGETARDFYLEQNGCSMESVPELVGLHERVVGARESHECANYTGCDDGVPVRWCEHSEGGYDGSTHGWPSFGGSAIRDFVWSLP